MKTNWHHRSRSLSLVSGPLTLRPGVGKFKSNQIDAKTTSCQIKSNQITHFFARCQIKSNHDLRRKIAAKSNHDLIPISNQNFGCNQNPVIKRSKSRFHRQIWHRSKALSELFPSVTLIYNTVEVS